jgi:hypothetical protein
MIVWVLTSGETNEGGTIHGIYADPEPARNDFATRAASLTFGIDVAEQTDNGALHLTAGCDWLSLEPHEVRTQPETGGAQ